MISAVIRIHTPPPRSGSPGAAQTAQCHTGSAAARAPIAASGCSIRPVRQEVPASVQAQRRLELGRAPARDQVRADIFAGSARPVRVVQQPGEVAATGSGSGRSSEPPANQLGVLIDMAQESGAVCGGRAEVRAGAAGGVLPGHRLVQVGSCAAGQAGRAISSVSSGTAKNQICTGTGIIQTKSASAAPGGP